MLGSTVRERMVYFFTDAYTYTRLATKTVKTHMTYSITQSGQRRAGDGETLFVVGNFPYRLESFKRTTVKG